MHTEPPSHVELVETSRWRVVLDHGSCRVSPGESNTFSTITVWQRRVVSGVTWRTEQIFNYCGYCVANHRLARARPRVDGTKESEGMTDIGTRDGGGVVYHRTLQREVSTSSIWDGGCL